MNRIMVLDNDIQSNHCIVSMLLMEGFDAVGIFHAKKGIELLEKQLFDLIVTEIVMPEKDGIEVLLSIKKNKQHIPVIAISGGGKICPEFYLNLAKQFGVDYTFVKPVSILPFLYAIKKCLLHTKGYSK